MTAPTVAQDTPASLAIAEPYQRPAITARGATYLRLAEFRDLWAGLGPEDRAYFTEDLRDLLSDAGLPETA